MRAWLPVLLRRLFGSGYAWSGYVEPRASSVEGDRPNVDMVGVSTVESKRKAGSLSRSKKSDVERAVDIISSAAAAAAVVVDGSAVSLPVEMADGAASLARLRGLPDL